LEINGNTTNSSVTVNWGDISSNLPLDYAAYVYDPSTGQITDMLSSNSMEISQIFPIALEISIYSSVLGLLDAVGVPKTFSLHQNYPNPFNPSTKIRYDLPNNAYVNIDIYDVIGRNIKSLVNTFQTAGYRSIHWNATNDLGQPVSAGMYFYTINAGEFRQTRKMILLK